MFKKKSLLLLGIGYLGGIAVALKYHKKTAASLKEELAKTDKKCGVFWKHIVQIHRDLFTEAKEAALSPENMEKLEAYKQKLLVHVDEFRKDADAKIADLKQKGIQKKDELEVELKKLYDRRVELLDQAKTKGSELLTEAVEHGKKYFEEAKVKLHEAFEELKKAGK